MTKISEFTTQIADGLNATDRFEVARPGQAVEFYATPEDIKEYVITPNIAALDALTTTGVIERTGPGTAATFAVSAFAKTLLDDANAATVRGTLGLGTIATQSAASVAITGGSITGITDLAIADGGTGASTAVNARANLGLGTIATQAASSVTITGGNITGITDLAIADGGTGASTAAGARTNLGLVIGTDVQAYDADLATLAGLAPSDGNFIVGNGSAWTVESGATARTSLGLNWTKVADLTPINGFAAVAGWPNELWVAGNLAMVRYSLAISSMPVSAVALSWAGYAAVSGAWGNGGITSTTGIFASINPNDSPNALKFENPASLPGALGYLLGSIIYIWS